MSEQFTQEAQQYLRECGIVGVRGNEFVTLETAVKEANFAEMHKAGVEGQEIAEIYGPASQYMGEDEPEDDFEDDEDDDLDDDDYDGDDGDDDDEDDFEEEEVEAYEEVTDFFTRRGVN